MRRVATIIALLLVGSAALAAPKADLWPRWQAHAAHSTATIDHSAYNAFLQKYVVAHTNGPNGVRYGQVSSADKKKLEGYIRRMEGIAIDHYNRDVQRAYWTNLYNAETLDLVLNHYPVASIRNIGGSLFSPGPWKRKVLEVEGRKLSLDDIEDRILRPIWHDPLTHYGLNCASMSCPSLLPSAYTGANINARLRRNARAYINSPEGVRIDHGQVTASSIYDWYQSDFGGDIAGVISHQRRYAAPDLSARLGMLHHIDHYDYDWSLNDEARIEQDRTSP